MKRIRLASMLVLLLLAASIAQAAPPAIPQGWSKYILILNDASFRPARGHVAVAAPDIPQLGGKVLQQWGRRFSVALPPGLAATLRNHPAVRELQRVYTGTPLPEEVPPSVLRLQSTAMHGAADSAPPTWSSGEYVYDGSGNIKNIGWGTGTTLNGDGKSNTYVYDTAGRLVSATANYEADGTETYTYDAFGNMTSVTHNGQASSFAIDSGSNRLQGVLYDLAGNLVNDGTQWYGYDALNMLRQQSGFREGEAYIYTADDERIGTDENVSIRWTIRDFGGNVLREFDGLVDSDWSFVKDYVYRDGQLLASHGDMADGSTLIHYHLDHLGTPRLVTTQSERRVTQDDYFPFGTEQTSLSQATTLFGFEGELTHRFTGHERNFLGDPAFEDVSYIDYMHARYYEPKRGRFLSVDPVLGNLMRPQSWNRYAYVLDNPMRSTDPSGMAIWIIGEIGPGDPWNGERTGFATMHDFFMFLSGAVNEYGSANLMNGGRQNIDDDWYERGQLVGDAGLVLQGLEELGTGFAGEVEGFGLDATEIGAFIGVPVQVVSSGLIAHGGTVTGIGAWHMMSGIKQRKDGSLGQFKGKEAKAAENSQLKHAMKAAGHGNDRDKQRLIHEALQGMPRMSFRQMVEFIKAFF